MSLTWHQALAWRLRMQLLEPVGTKPVEGVVARLGAVPAQSISTAELAVRSRRMQSAAGEVADALTAGTIIRTFAFRGATHFMTPVEGADYLALRASSRMWELPSWQKSYRLAPADWPALRETVRDALGDGPLTIDELGAAVTARPAYRHLTGAFADRSFTIVKPFAWQGDICFAPSRNGMATVQRLDRNPHWAGLPDIEDAGRSAVQNYLRAYGPATPDHLQYWLGAGLGAARRRLGRWISDLDDRLVTVDIEGDPAMVLREDLDGLADTTSTTSVVLLPGHDQWVLGPGTADAHVVPPTRRAAVTRGANIVVANGVVSGTWSLRAAGALVSWFPECGPPPREALASAVDRLAGVLDRPLRSTIEVAR
jgi:hypothetical protein